jgi:hypothetical protein
MILTKDDSNIYIYKYTSGTGLAKIFTIPSTDPIYTEELVKIHHFAQNIEFYIATYDTLNTEYHYYKCLASTSTTTCGLFYKITSTAGSHYYFNKNAMLEIATNAINLY